MDDQLGDGRKATLVQGPVFPSGLCELSEDGGNRILRVFRTARHLTPATANCRVAADGRRLDEDAVCTGLFKRAVCERFAEAVPALERMPGRAGSAACQCVEPDHSPASRSSRGRAGAPLHRLLCEIARIGSICHVRCLSPGHAGRRGELYA